MQRFRAGVTGLAFVFLVTLVASFAWPAMDEAGPASETSSRPAGEPLAQLGVAPSSEPANAEPYGERPFGLPAAEPRPAFDRAADPIAQRSRPAEPPTARIV